MGSPRSLGAPKSNMGVHVENHSASLKLWGGYNMRIRLVDCTLGEDIK
jgi:hypothetical protein